MSQQQPEDYLSYKKNKMAKESDKGQIKKAVLWVFVLTFTFCFMVVINVTSRYGRKMDIEYGRALSTKNVNANDPYVKGINPITEFIDDRKNQVDIRLRLLQLEETAPNEAKIIDKNREKDVLDPAHFKSLLEEEEKAAHAPKVEAPEKPTTEAKPVFSKVLIGRYRSFDEAKEAQNELREASGAVTFIRKMGDIYSLQVGSYTNEGIAQEVADKYSGNYPVWILQN